MAATRWPTEGRDCLLCATDRQSTAQNLVCVLRETSNGRREWRGRRVHVIGAGAMGGDIAAWCAWNGFDGQPWRHEGRGCGRDQARQRHQEHLGCTKAPEIRDVSHRLVPDLRGDGIRSADLVIEAVPEKLELKQRIYAAVEQQMRADAILATNTSSIALEQLPTGLRRPERFLGVALLQPGLAHATRRGRQPRHGSARGPRIRQRVPGASIACRRRRRAHRNFGQPRAHAVHDGSLHPLDQGTPKETIDAAAERFGMPMGPIRR